MTTPFWESGTLYPPGSLVQPITTPAPAGAAIPNPGFESGDSDWTKGAGWTIINDAGDAFAGSWCAQFDHSGTSEIEMAAGVAVAAGRSITATAQFDQGASSGGELTGVIKLNWYDGAAALISSSTGNVITSGTDGRYAASTVTGIAPASAATVKVAFSCTRNAGNEVARVDNFTWNYASVAIPEGLVYRAVQAETGYSGESEPAWPSTLGVTVVDNEVTWEAVQGSRVEWTAVPILKSGPSEPDWPTAPGETVLDNTIIWQCVSRRVEDENCPNTSVVVILASKIFCADGDIVRFSATANPLDWTSQQDAGYLPTGLQQANANDMAVLNQYRSNLVGFNASSFQNWQVDPDPAAMALLDQMDGVGSTWQRAACPVGNELFYLCQLGVRSVGIANAAENLVAGDVGMPIDPLVREAIATAVDNGLTPIATYYPGAGQYWLVVPETGPNRIAAADLAAPNLRLLQEDDRNEFVTSTKTGADTTADDNRTMDFSPDGRWLAVPNGATGVSIYEWDGTAYTQGTSIALTDAVAATFSPDGEHLFVGRAASASHGAFKVYSHDGAGTFTEILSHETADWQGWAAAWPDDSQALVIAVTSSGATPGEVLSYSRAGDVYTLGTFPSGGGNNNYDAVFAADLLLVTSETYETSIFRLTDEGYTYIETLAAGMGGGTIVSPDRQHIIIENVVYARTGNTFAASGAITGTTGGLYHGKFLSDGRLLYVGDTLLYMLEPDGEDYAVVSATGLPTSVAWSIAVHPGIRAVPDTCTAFVYTMNRAGRAGSWSRYVFPFAIDSFAQLGNVLYIRHGNTISRVDEDAVTDEVDGEPVNFPGLVQFPWHDFGQPGVTKMLEGFDYIGSGQGPSISIGYDQRSTAAFTTPYDVDPDTMPGGLIPLPLAAPTLSVKLAFAGGAAWSVQAVHLSLFDMGNGP